MTDPIKFEARSALELKALREAVKDLVYNDEEGWTVEDCFEEATDPAFVDRMERAGKTLDKQIDARAGFGQVILDLTPDEATFLRAALEWSAEKTSNFTGAWGVNVKQFPPHKPVEHYDALEKACWDMAERLPEETWR